MVEVVKNRQALDRKQFLMRALHSHNITQEEYDAEVKELDKEITANLQEALAAAHAELKDEVLQIKKTVYTDGNMKRSIARVLITFLKADFTGDEIRGIMRQGYKIMRREL